MMEASTSGGGGGGGPAPFLLKTYEMIDDVSTDEIVSWTPAGNSFIVWNQQEFASQLLPQYFKHNNFSSFIRQLNTYGFHKIDPELWEFANEDFMRDHKHLLKNIHRRKPMHSHSQSLTHAAGSFGEAERAALEEEIQRLRKEKNSIESSLAKSRQQQQKTKDWLEKIEPRVNVMEKRHSILAQFVNKAMANPSYIENFVKEVEKNFELMVVKRKRRLPRTDSSRELVENDFFRSKLVESSPPVTPPNPDVSKVGNKGSPNKLRLELSPATSNISRQGSSDDGEESEFEQNRGEQYNGAIITECSHARESLELLDTCTSVSCPKDSLLSRTPMEEFDSQVPFHLNLTLYSTPLQDDASGCLSKSSFDVVLEKDRQNNNKNTPAERSNASKTGLSTSKEIAAGNTASSIPPVKVNDQFWEQFLTEKTGSLDNEEASSSFREHPYNEVEQRKLGSGKAWSKKHVLQQFSL